jgi:hypothetical protein
VCGKGRSALCFQVMLRLRQSCDAKRGKAGIVGKEEENLNHNQKTRRGHQGSGSSLSASQYLLCLYLIIVGAKTEVSVYLCVHTVSPNNAHKKFLPVSHPYTSRNHENMSALLFVCSLFTCRNSKFSSSPLFLCHSSIKRSDA